MCKKSHYTSLCQSFPADAQPPPASFQPASSQPKAAIRQAPIEQTSGFTTMASAPQWHSTLVSAC